VVIFEKEKAKAKRDHSFSSPRIFDLVAITTARGTEEIIQKV
jgi:hypothetical protein